MKKLAAIALGIALAGTATVALAGRNSSGTYSLPSGNPVVSGTSISSTWANNTLGDLSAEVTSSLDRSGRGGMLAPLRVPNGSAGAPTLSFSNETSSGWYRAALGDLRLSVGGVDRCTVTASGLSIAGTLSTSGNATVGGTLASGAVTAPSIKRSGGAFQIGTTDANVLQFVQNGIVRWTLDTSGDLVATDTSRKVKNVYGPTDPTDAANKAYVDGKFAAPSWTAITGINGWANANAYYWKDSVGVVHVRGNVSAGPTPASGTFAQLPAGYRPGAYFRSSISDQAYGPNTLTINTDGTMVVNSYVANTAYNVSASFVAEN